MPMKKFLLTSLLCGSMGFAMAQAPADYLSVKDCTTGEDGTVTVNIEMVNPGIAACAFQCDIVLPEGVTPDVTSLVVGDRNSTHTIASNILSDGTYRILCYSMTNADMTGTDGIVASFKTSAPVADGDYTFTVKNAELVDKASIAKIIEEGVNSTVTVGDSSIYGDADGDGYVDAGDIIPLTSLIMTNSYSPKADLDNDGYVDASDLVILISIILK